ncbi:MAG TPA: bifunctional UDP-N-acetylglucosamine diphosphorylase/glucosamine-1-phosphate N-acetyltransferase GlmU [Nitrospira sp.]|nr:bifunctional UDP-N-acetylglucosamine diphosphorylase/glucosamine-1-phosphate N-acetyltransferase GlmU [Nitrospira sp.]
MSRSPVQPPLIERGERPVPGVAAVVMAAGLGKRMHSKHAKVLHPVAGRPMVLYAVELALRVAGDHVAVVVGHQADRVGQVIKQATEGTNGHMPVAIVEQRELLGTGHAVLQTRPVFLESGRPLPSQFIILNGDTPLLQERTLRGLLDVHRQQKAAVTLLTAVLDDASGYGRVVRSSSGESVSRIVEDRDADSVVKAIREINVGTYVVEGDVLFAALQQLQPTNAQGEFYLTDIVQAAAAQGRRVDAVTLEDPDEGLGVNTRGQLAEAEQVVRRQIRRRWLEAGVRMIDPASTWIDAGVTIGRDSVLHPNVILEGSTVIGEDVVVRAGTRITDCIIGNRVEILDHCVCRESQIEDDATLGPFAHLRPHVLVRKGAKIGNFVEAKNAELGEGSKANHLTYLGDTKIGKGVNIGAGTITCNYDGVRKAETIIEDGVFIGSDTQLVAPVRIGAGSIIAAGTTVTQNVPLDSLVISRVMQVTRAGWAAKRRALLAEGGNASTQRTPSGTKKGTTASSGGKRKPSKRRSR